MEAECGDGVPKRCALSCPVYKQHFRGGNKNLPCWSAPVLVAGRKFNLIYLSCIHVPLIMTPSMSAKGI